METAAKRLEEIKTDKPTEQAAESAAERFKQLIDSLKADAAVTGGRAASRAGAAGAAGVAVTATTTAFRATAQLKLLKTLQQEINERTEELDEQRRARELSLPSRPPS